MKKSLKEKLQKLAGLHNNDQQLLEGCEEQRLITEQGFDPFDGDPWTFIEWGPDYDGPNVSITDPWGHNCAEKMFCSTCGSGNLSTLLGQLADFILSEGLPLDTDFNTIYWETTSWENQMETLFDLACVKPGSVFFGTIYDFEDEDSTQATIYKYWRYGVDIQVDLETDYGIIDFPEGEAEGYIYNLQDILDRFDMLGVPYDEYYLTNASWSDWLTYFTSINFTCQAGHDTAVQCTGICRCECGRPDGCGPYERYTCNNIVGNNNQLVGQECVQDNMYGEYESLEECENSGCPSGHTGFDTPPDPVDDEDDEDDFSDEKIKCLCCKKGQPVSMAQSVPFNVGCSSLNGAGFSNCQTHPVSGGPPFSEYECKSKTIHHQNLPVDSIPDDTTQMLQRRAGIDKKQP